MIELSSKLRLAGIYKIENLVNHNFYIGSSSNLHKRKNQHFSMLKKGNNYNKNLQKEYNLYGIENFAFIIILLCEKEYLTYYEQKCVDILKPAYNICVNCVTSTKGVPSPMLNKHHSEETKRKISQSLLGHPSNFSENYQVTDEQRKMISCRMQGFTMKEGKYAGVCRRKTSKKWRARISYMGDRIDLGLFETAEEAAQAYNIKALELYGPSAKLNVIEKANL